MVGRTGNQQREKACNISAEDHNTRDGITTRNKYKLIRCPIF